MTASQVHSAHAENADIRAGQRRRTAGGFEEMEFLVPSMHCGGCMRTIENGLIKVEGIKSARTNLSVRRVLVSWEQGVQTVEGVRAALEALGFDATPFDPRLAMGSEKARGQQLLRAIAVSGFAAANVMLLSVSVWAGFFSDMDVATRDLFHWLSALIALPAVVYAGRPFFYSAASALKVQRMNMDVPISLAIILASAASLAETIRGAEHVYFDASVTLLFFLLIGRYLDLAMRGRAGEAARNLLALQAISATKVMADGSRISVAVDMLQPDDRVFVAPGMRIPADGTVVDGTSDVDTSLLSGESVPEQAVRGTQVFAGTLNLSGPLQIVVTAAKDDTVLSEIARLMEAAEQGRAGFVRLADRLSRIYAPVVHILAGGTFLVWLLIGAGWHQALMTAVALLIITCPCALALAVPVVQVVASGRLLRRGILLKSADGLERLAKVDYVVFDKTGTLTDGTASLVNADDIRREDMALAAALGAQSHHPLALAVTKAGADLIHPTLGPVTEVPGFGMEAELAGKTVRLGRREWVGAPDVTDHGGPELWLAVKGDDPVRFMFKDRLRKDAVEVVAHLQRLGIETRLLSGDRRAAVAHVAMQLGIGNWRAEARPQDKITYLEELKAQGCTILMVGDGLNDAPALRAAHVSMSPGSAADISQRAADFVFQGENLSPVIEGIQTARRARSLVFQNFGVAFSYNAIAIPLAALGYVTPLIAAIAMSSSSLLVTLNALRLRLSEGSRR